ncbi:MAG: Gram-negative bacterial TonB protein C-terminal [Bacteroidetes bacterium]|nr:Gram-negative bacterial TonB protein C-terminal [Bacteroidota bacterium]
MKRSSLLAGLLTIGLHVVLLGALSLWSIGGGDVARALGALPEPDIAPAPSSAIPSSAILSMPDTVTPPIVIPDEAPVKSDSAGPAPSGEAVSVASGRAIRTEVTPVLMLSWQKGGNRRKTLGALPTLEGPLAADVTASFKVMVAPDGKVRSVRVVKSKDAAFEKAAVARIKKWKFEPLRSPGRPPDQLCTVTLRARAR